MYVLAMKAAYTSADNTSGCFSIIDQKLELLQHCSNETFFAYNNTLNEATQVLGGLLDKGYKIIDRPSAGKNFGLPKSTQSPEASLRDKFVEFENQIHLMYEMLEKIEANLSLMFSPISNFRHNLAALKPFLVKLNLPNADINISSFKISANSTVHLSDKIIDKIIDSCPVFEENIFNIKKHLRQLRQDFAPIKESIAHDIIQKYDNLLCQSETLGANIYKTLIEKEKLETIKAKCQNLEELFQANLIDQNGLWSDLEQIRYTHRTTSEGHYKTVNNGSTNGQNQPLKPRLIPNEIAKLQIGQIICANEHYKNITEQISRKIAHIGLDIAELTEINHSDETDLEAEASRLSQQVAEFTNTVNQGIDNYILLSKEIGLVNKIVNDLHSKYLDIDLIDNSVEQRIIDRINFSNLLISAESETASNAQQILKLYAANHFEKNKLKTLFQNAKIELKEFVRSNMEFAGDRKGVEKLNDSIAFATAHSKAIVGEIAEINSIKNDILAKGVEINIAVNRVLNSITANDLFERTIDELVEQIEQVSCPGGVKKQKVNGNKTNQDYIFEKIEKYFTMNPEPKIQYAYDSNMLLRPGSCERKF